jgi:hypothetical protein
MVAHLAISSPLVASDCSDVIRMMKKLGISGDVTPNVTILDGDLENGCKIVVASAPHREKARILWDALRTPLGLTCAHVRVESRVEGCVLDVFRPSACTGQVPTG